MKFFAALATLVATASSIDTDKCCTVCPAGEVKTYSIDTKANHCGVSCIKQDKFWLYHVFEKNLTDAKTNTPCEDHGYGNYWMTETHGFPHLLTVQVDFFNQTAPAAPFSKNFFVLIM